MLDLFPRNQIGLCLIRQKRLPITALLVIAVLPFCCSAQDQTGTSAPEVLQNYVEALGGEMVLRSLEAIKYEGTINPAGTHPSSFSCLYAPGRGALRVVELAPGHVNRVGFDGEHIWRQRGHYAIRHRAEGFEIRELELPGMPTTALEWLERKDKAILLDTKRIDGRVIDVIRIGRVEGQLVTGFFDRESGLLVQSVYGDGSRASEYRFEYAEEPIDGVRFVNKTTRSMSKTTSHLIVDRFVVNPELDGNEFRIPDGVEIR
ncbi:MAG: hypothetical protein ACR2NP_21550 [Pirellulaceae bacterium]